LAADATNLTYAQKAAVVITQMPQELASAVLAEMSEVEVSRLTRLVATLPDLEPGPVKEVMGEFLDRVRTVAAVKQGGLDVARRLLRDRLGTAKAEEELEALLRAEDRRPFAFLHSLEPERVASLLTGEHPQVIAVVVAHLSAELGAAVLSALDEGTRAEVAVRIGTMGKLPSEAVVSIARALSGQVLDAYTAPDIDGSSGGASALAAMLNRSDRQVERQVLAAVEAADPNLAEEVRRQLFTFEDVLALDDRTLQKVLRAVQPKTLATALKGASAEALEKFTRNMSENAAKDLEEEIEYLGPLRLSEVEGAQMDIARKVREMEAEGEIVVIRQGDEVVL
jgi:flagellar motor switch protein FliG